MRELKPNSAGCHTHPETAEFWLLDWVCKVPIAQSTQLRRGLLRDMPEEPSATRRKTAKSFCPEISEQPAKQNRPGSLVYRARSLGGYGAVTCVPADMVRKTAGARFRCGFWGPRSGRKLHGKAWDGPLNAFLRAFAISSMHFFPASRSPAIRKKPWSALG